MPVSFLLMLILNPLLQKHYLQNLQIGRSQNEEPAIEIIMNSWGPFDSNFEWNPDTNRTEIKILRDWRLGARDSRLRTGK